MISMQEARVYSLAQQLTLNKHCLPRNPVGSRSDARSVVFLPIPKPLNDENN